MRSARRIGIAVVTAALAIGAGIGRADGPSQQSADPPDEGLLEFLGSVDSSSDATQPDDGSWLTYLSQVDLGKAGKAAQAPQAPQSPAPPKPAGAANGADKPGG
jgi:hypothetical protein